jgi:hypothetical protein
VLAGVVSAPLVVSAGAAAAAGSELLLEQPMTKPPRIAAIASVRIVVSLWVLYFRYSRRTLIQGAKRRQYLSRTAHPSRRTTRLK